MAGDYRSPGIYIEELSIGPKPIEAVGTSTPGFVGVAPKADAFVNDVRAVNNWSEIFREFTTEGSKSTDLSHAVFGFFQNGGQRCYVVNVGGDKPISGGARRTGLDLFEEIDEIAIVAAPGFSDPGSYDVLLTHCEKLKDRVAILDPPAEVAKIEQLTQTASVPAAPPRRGQAGRAADAGGAPVTEESTGGVLPTNRSPYGALYFPRIRVRDPLSPTGETVIVPPSGHIAGIYARTDATRGVYKAPANEAVRGAVDLPYRVTKAEQAM